MIKNTNQDWTVGATVKVGFLKLRVIAARPTPLVLGHRGNEMKITCGCPVCPDCGQHKACVPCEAPSVGVGFTQYRHTVKNGNGEVIGLHPGKSDACRIYNLEVKR